ncbi:hypothetical protein BDW02DRAFT_297857 [Decorospora gaudefroyi]|uniref:Uncharacterized protein n=1 Tax=Decorospora gaudefroyi TaxID=184978 RepID=A0A6A5KFY6_9PLEO|nr:hypothetical protein BDW02DRAFT_297857 [Decorospora gaudefroyi]
MLCPTTTSLVNIQSQLNTPSSAFPHTQPLLNRPIRNLILDVQLGLHHVQRQPNSTMARRNTTYVLIISVALTTLPFLQLENASLTFPYWRELCIPTTGPFWWKLNLGCFPVPCTSTRGKLFSTIVQRATSETQDVVVIFCLIKRRVVIGREVNRISRVWDETQSFSTMWIF